MKILIIDDEPFMLSSLKDLIVGLGYHCETANNGKRAFELLKNKNSFDAIICDFNMPEMTGLELRLKLRDEFDSCPPFILLSGDISQVKDDKYRQLSTSISRIASLFSNRTPPTQRVDWKGSRFWCR